MARKSVKYHMVRLTLEQYDHKSDTAVEKRKISQAPFTQFGGSFIVEMLKIIIITLAIVLPVRFFLFQPYFVDGASMEPNFYDRQYLIVDEITYRFEAPERGDVVVIKVPFEREALIKRIIGLPGETVEINNTKIKIYNDESPQGFWLNEEYLGQSIGTNGNNRLEHGQDQYYVLGDNRPVSLDSRYFGAINKDQIIGKAWLRLWPFDSVRHFGGVIYTEK